MNEKKFAERAVYKALIKAPIETVWSELVNTSEPRPFFYDSCWDTPGIAPGAPYRMVSRDGRTVAVIGEILSMDPPHRLETTFRLTNLDDPPSRVIYELKETPDGVEFSLITENVPLGTKSEKSMDEGARFIVDNFKAFIETGKVMLGARIMFAMFSLMAPLAPKKMRADNWPLPQR